MLALTGGPITHCVTKYHFCCLSLQVAEEIWVCANQTVTKWEGDIFSYKEALIHALEKEEKKMQK